MSEWKDMPEFIQEKQESFSKIIIRCETEEDLEELAKLLGQKLTPPDLLSEDRFVARFVATKVSVEPSRGHPPPVFELVAGRFTLLHLPIPIFCCLPALL